MKPERPYAQDISEAVLQPTVVVGPSHAIAEVLVYNYSGVDAWPQDDKPSNRQERRAAKHGKKKGVPHG